MNTKSFLIGTVSSVALALNVFGQEPSGKPQSDSATPPKIPVRDFFKNPVSRSYLLSPDGKTIFFYSRGNRA